ncbi:TetR/AcrR family transcriptional regulator [Thermosynechococcaceae cyanobacterium BACA0444]|uniref:TetR/AcrR family transcriptional regulator n=1 Tax=Pseudocalidococcus azoricus BACA0444 TaxID=2918990 RepID=A0AAE4FUD6_9CYAN|nr:TetR/AcrR family transcriptional regulator [Pseudocalidococcus azoricus]MDS3862430.1 TetR/AcrR family transcriptional regulator [Pseudocalidococcus azoricus BACA0444]
MLKNSVIGNNGVTDYRAAQNLHQQALRQGILDDASNLLLSEGLQALSMRRIAQMVGCSTTVLYTMFGSKQGLVDELYLKGFARLRQALEAVPKSDNLLEYLIALGQAYRAFALANSTYYAVMFCQTSPEFTPTQNCIQQSWSSFVLLVSTVQACIDTEIFVKDNAQEVAKMLWAIVHGHVGLELTGHFKDSTSADDRFNRTIRTILAGLTHQQFSDQKQRK